MGLRPHRATGTEPSAQISIAKSYDGARGSDWRSGGTCATPAGNEPGLARERDRQEETQGAAMHSTPHCRWTRLPRAARAGVALAIAGLALAACSEAESAGNYPTKPVRIFVPYGPGGVGDLTMRLVADKLSQSLKQQFVVENRPGAGGIANATAVMRAQPDGYTLIEIGNGSTISMSLFKDLPYNVLTDFASVSITGSFEMLLGVPENSPYKSLKDVVDAAKKNPGKINLGAINPGSTQNLSAHLFEQVTGAKYTIIT